MTISKRINALRRRLMHGLTSRIHNAHLKQYHEGVVSIRRVLVCRPNKRLGNLLLMTPLVAELETRFPGCEIDLFVGGGLAPVIFKNDQNIRSVIELPGKPFKNLPGYLGKWFALTQGRYDLAINVIEYSSSGKISALVARAKYKLLTDREDEREPRPSDYLHAGKFPVYALRNYLTHLGIPQTGVPVPPLNLKLTAEEMEAGRKALGEIFQNEKDTICIFTYATGDKCYPESWWEPFYEALKARYPGYNILEVLPKENISKIGFKAPTFYSLDIRQIAAVIKATRVFIGADSGMMHLASASGTPTIGLFSVTNEKVYGPYGNGSAAVRTVAGDTGNSFEVLRDILGH